MYKISTRFVCVWCWGLNTGLDICKAALFETGSQVAEASLKLPQPLEQVGLHTCATIPGCTLVFWHFHICLSMMEGKPWPGWPNDPIDSRTEIPEAPKSSTGPKERQTGNCGNTESCSAADLLALSCLASSSFSITTSPERQRFQKSSRICRLSH